MLGIKIIPPEHYGELPETYQLIYQSADPWAFMVNGKHRADQYVYGRVCSNLLP
jgi:hypothetical protein